MHDMAACMARSCSSLNPAARRDLDWFIIPIYGIIIVIICDFCKIDDDFYCNSVCSEFIVAMTTFALFANIWIFIVITCDFCKKS
jgi:hypothetical protein